MASKVNRTRATKKLQADTEALTKADRLLVAQAVFEYGANAWAQVSDKLAKHALISRPAAFTPQVPCSF
jgi:bromodomain-containing protein 8